jgi:hypothetical protein
MFCAERHYVEIWRAEWRVNVSQYVEIIWKNSFTPLTLSVPN